MTTGQAVGYGASVAHDAAHKPPGLRAGLRHVRDGDEAMGISVEITTGEFTLTLSTDTPGWNPDVATDLIHRLDDALATAAHHCPPAIDDDE